MPDHFDLPGELATARHDRRQAWEFWAAATTSPGDWSMAPAP